MWLWNRSLEQRLSKQSSKQIPELNPCQKVGILFDATQEINRSIVKNYKRKLKQQGCEVYLLGFIDKKLKHNLFEFLMYHKGMVNWYEKPEAKDVEDFLNRKMDILFNLDMNNHLHMHYIAGAADAAFKVSLDHSFNKPYQLIMDIDHKDQLKNVISELETHLKKLSI